MRLFNVAVLWLILCASCGPKLPPRFVVERDLGPYRYRRYQQVLDVDVPIQGNPAVGHTATYVRAGRPVRVVPVFVTKYTRARGLTDTVRTRLRQTTSYDVLTREVDGSYVYRMQGESGDTWLCWVSGPFFVKVGAAEGEQEVAEDIVETYLDVYPSDFDDKGRARKDAASAGAAPEPAAAVQEEKGSTP